VSRSQLLSNRYPDRVLIFAACPPPPGKMAKVISITSFDYLSYFRAAICAAWYTCFSFLEADSAGTSEFFASLADFSREVHDFWFPKWTNSSRSAGSCAVQSKRLVRYGSRAAG